MNYTRRANRPDANHYREMRRRTLGSAPRGYSRRRSSGPLSRALWLLVLIIACAVFAWVWFRK